MDLQNTGATSIVALFKTNKGERESFVSQVIESLKEGNVNSLELHLQIKCMEDIIEQIKSDMQYKLMVLEEAEKSGKAFDFQSSKIAIREVGTKYDFSNTNDPIYMRLESVSSIASKELKERADFLKKVPLSGMVILDEDTGEAVTIYPPSTTSTTSVVVTLK